MINPGPPHENTGQTQIPTNLPDPCANSRCRAASTDASLSSTPPPGAVQYGACPSFVRLINTS